MGDTAISWTDKTWNPVRGCSRVSAGCQRCYAEQQAARIVRMGKGKPTAYDGLVKLVGGEARWTGEVRLVAEHLADPLKWRKPVRIFVNSMSDLFHEKLTNEEIAAVFGVMAACQQHTFQVLTKRARRMREWFAWAREYLADFAEITVTALGEVGYDYGDGAMFVPDRLPLRNVWLGVSVENQDAADERWPYLRDTPAAVRFFSAEPLLGPLDFTHVFADLTCKLGKVWVIAGCESGPGARPCLVEWLRSLRDQCAAAGVPFFLKQAVPGTGSLASDSPRPAPIAPGLESKWKPGGVIELPYLDGVQHAEFPEVSP